MPGPRGGFTPEERVIYNKMDPLMLMLALGQERATAFLSQRFKRQVRGKLSQNLSYRTMSLMKAMNKQ
jgi:hypothetical protein